MGVCVLCFGACTFTSSVTARSHRPSSHSKSVLVTIVKKLNSLKHLVRRLWLDHTTKTANIKKALLLVSTLPCSLFLVPYVSVLVLSPVLLQLVPCRSALPIPTSALVISMFSASAARSVFVSGSLSSDCSFIVIVVCCVISINQLID